tara:strand:+ start:136 stop:879 length:744 start_codon:yes stop_codon:yes gene_type:complete
LIINIFGLKLVIDIGNTLTKVALFEKKNIYKTIILKSINIEVIKDFIKNKIVTNTIFSSVKDSSKDLLSIINNFNAIELNDNVKIPIKINYNNINDLGKDRLAAIIGAINLYSNENILILDIGTCLTIDFINNNEYVGGRISPGLKMRYKALNKFTAKLPLCEKNFKNLKYGNSTLTSIQSGVQRGMINEIDTVITEFKQENKNNVVIGTGGDCFFFEKELKNSIFADQFLVLRGLNEILDFNVQSN